MSHIIAQKVIKRLREEHPELLKDVTREEAKEFNLDNLDPEMLPSEMKKLSDAIARRRVEAPPMPKEEAKALLRRIGH